MGFLGQKMAVMVVVVWVAMMAAAVRGQTVPSCGSQLVPCASYLNSTNAPEGCCKPLRDVVNNDITCLCAIYKSPEILKAFNISIEQALQLSRRCGITSGLSVCTGAPAPGSVPPPATSGGGGANGSGSAHGATWLGVSGLISLFFCWSILA